MAKYNGVAVRQLLNVLKALGDESRLRALYALRGRELCVCQIVELLELAPSTVSKHMSVLHAARLVESRKEGRWVFYALPEEGPPPVAAAALEAMSRTRRAGEDEKRLKEILEADRKELCKRQSGR